MTSRTLLLLVFALLGLSAAAQQEMCVLSHLRAIPSATTLAFDGAPQIQTQPFRAVGPFILVTATVGGVVGSYILDSGAPGLVINGAVAIAVDSALALDRYVMIGQRNVGELRWGPIKQRAAIAYVLDLSHLERSLGEPISGLIGYEQLRQLPITIDYPKRVITFLRKHSEAKVQGIALPFELSGHLPLVEAEVGGRQATLGFDTGSGVNLLDKAYFGQLASSSAELPEMRVRGLGATDETIARRSVALTTTSHANWVNLPYGFADLTRFRDSPTAEEAIGAQLDGLLGKEWMQQRVVTLDYARRRLYIR